MSKLYFIPLGVGTIISLIGILYSVIFNNWSEVTNVLGGIGLACMAGPVFGGYGEGDYKHGNNDLNIIGDGFRSQKERMRNRLQGLRFGMFILFLGLPMLAVSVGMYFLH